MSTFMKKDRMIGALSLQAANNGIFIIGRKTFRRFDELPCIIRMYLLIALIR